jgi:hypothetical protein
MLPDGIRCSTACLASNANVWSATADSHGVSRNAARGDSRQLSAGQVAEAKGRGWLPDIVTPLSPKNHLSALIWINAAWVVRHENLLASATSGIE